MYEEKTELPNLFAAKAWTSEGCVEIYSYLCTANVTIQIMKKTMIMALAAFVMCGSARAQYYEADSGLSVMGLFGMTVSNLHMNDMPGDGMDPKAGFTVGMRAEYMLPECRGVFVNAGLEYTMKGARERVSATIDDMVGVGATGIARPMYVQLPIHVGYRYDLLEDLGVYADFGPYFAVGTNGKYRIKYDNFASDLTQNFFNSGETPYNYEMQRWDFGLGFRLGAEYARHYNFQVGCDWGITDMLTQEQKHGLVTNPLLGIKAPAVRNFNAALTFAYRF